MVLYLIDRVNQGEGVYVYKVHNIVENHLSISVAIVPSRGGSLVMK
jgi:hypothetical protein